MCKVITFANFKGGAGKTTNCVMTAHALATMGYKVLVVDKDPQANATTLLFRTLEQITGEEVTASRYLLDGIEQGSFDSCIVEITNKLHVLPTTPKFQYYPIVLEKMFKGVSDQKDLERVAYFGQLLEPLKKEYDFIFIDVPPTISKFTDAALYATDYVVVVLQTQERSLQGAEIFIEYLNDIIVDKFDHELDVAGILPVIHKADSKVDQATLINAKDIFGEENLFTTQIKQMERLKRYDITGITDVDMHDKRVFDVYTNVANELLVRVKQEVKA